MLQEVWPEGKKDKEKAKNIEQISTFKAGMWPTDRHRAEEEREVPDVAPISSNWRSVHSRAKYAVTGVDGFGSKRSE